MINYDEWDNDLFDVHIHMHDLTAFVCKQQKLQGNPYKNYYFCESFAAILIEWKVIKIFIASMTTTMRKSRKLAL